MDHLNKKQKIIGGVIAVILIGLSCYYVYTKKEEKNIEIENNLEIESDLEIENSSDKNEENTESVGDNESILVHVSGAVKKEGVFELGMNSRISDAIEMARWIKRRCQYR